MHLRRFLVSLFDQFARDDAEDFLDSFAIFGADLMTAVPADLLTPEPAAPFAVDALPQERDAGGDGGNGVDGCGVKIFGHVGNTSLKRHFPLAGILRDDVTLGSHHVDDDIFSEVALQFHQPPAHLLEAVLIHDAVDQQHRGRAPVIQFGNAAEPFLAGGVPYLQPNGGAAVDVEHSFGQERCADRRRGFFRIKTARDITMDQRRLPHA